MNLLERDGELARLCGMAADVRRGVGGVALVSGPVASGKSALLHAFARRLAGGPAAHPARQRLPGGGPAGLLPGGPAVLLAATASRAERPVRLGVVRQLLAAAPLPAPARARAAALAASVAPDARVDAVVLHELGGLLLGLSRRGGLVVLVDDVHETDPESAWCLLFLARRAVAHGVLLVLADRSPTPAPHPRFHAELRRRPDLAQLRLAPLSPAAARRLLADRGVPTAERFVTRCHQLGGGSPALVTAVADDLAQDDGDGSLPTYRQALLHCLHRSDPEVVAVARALAVLPDGAPTQTVGALSRLDGHAVAAALRALAETGLVHGGGFRHPAARAAILDDLGHAGRADLRRRAAGLTPPGAPDDGPTGGPGGGAGGRSGDAPGAGPGDAPGVRAAALSAAERRVGALAAGGLSNREISRRLHVTVSTVEQHLTRVYRKLGVRRRGDLPGRLRRDADPPRRPSGTPPDIPRTPAAGPVP
ncbi:LuxR family transcriptional regulator [Micromonospora sp. WMMD882]|uniref:helix-turn-helix transcriptional regulator n=1 Tax=Micromonospora sp. WMMD882 TaxID=3015151 RepID=UPI00248B616E|nr:LuxR family transcriptional regulator [Micromonospora sp. WMMD882]WBB78706.1 LuxR family transcriptional regulator [Micromonospora sp. WMMD882]